MTEVSTEAGSKLVARWPDALFRVIHERDRAWDVAVALEQENARLREAIRQAESDLIGWGPEARAVSRRLLRVLIQTDALSDEEDAA